MLMCHFISCLWIFIGKNFQDDEIDGDNWIEAGEFEELTIGELYLTSFYFAVTTVTTVGYGDIGGNSTPERWLCFFLHLIGVLSYSYAAGSLTTIIANYDTINDESSERMDILNRMFQDNNLPLEHYNELREHIKFSSVQDDQKEIVDFLDDLPYRTKVSSIMHIY